MLVWRPRGEWLRLITTTLPLMMSWCREGKRVAEEAIGVAEQSAGAPEAKKVKIETSGEVDAPANVHEEPVHIILPAVAPVSPMDEGMSDFTKSRQILLMISP